MKKGQRMSKKERAAHGKRIKAAWKKRKRSKSNGTPSIAQPEAMPSNFVESVKARVRSLVFAEVDRQIKDMLG